MGGINTLTAEQSKLGDAVSKTNVMEEEDGNGETLK